jgi:hypothetical protein
LPGFAIRLELADKVDGWLLPLVFTDHRPDGGGGRRSGHLLYAQTHQVTKAKTHQSLTLLGQLLRLGSNPCFLTLPCIVLHRGGLGGRHVSDQQAE